ncbi:MULTISPECIES: ATP-binding protein [Chromobacterium]|uniref:histidine kinase n=2 Tax=Chromobacterium TaxID=535 RepID=A0ABS3GK34_9NEIS|nr:MULTISPECIES: ATP-binding protein [Chromobacterium]AXT48372.1 response regulator [Chromobacterium rhizoryzae]MBK0415600.1 transporter substrate-binding domain-containing protein [Chromobacterium haemolyticum]MBO0414980.1 transporter substrate-binding domain-containing protein [Chromobacterium haemolyticum]MBO0498241.1 transporter substrate-binding domain-containing protein [Chromobacterium haemolyticum]OQS35781.1 hypothetical protein B0T40_12060 [Chromobacterium haemolyticum]
MRARLLLFSCLLLAFCFPAGFCRAGLNPTERAWLAKHPVVRYAIDPHGWPIEYMEDGEHRGLTQAYLSRISEISGLRFELVPVANRQQAVDMMLSGRIDLLTALSSGLIPPEVGRRIRLSDPYFSGSTVLVTQPDKPIVFSTSKLSDKTIAVESGDPYEYFLRENFPAVDIVATPTPLAALDAVADGKAYAAVGLDAVMQSVIRRRYYGSLRIAGSVSEMPRLVSMAVNKEQPQLLSIINDSLAQLTADDTQQMLEDWLQTTDYGAPSWRSIARYYALELAGVSLVLLLLLAFAQRAHAARRAAQRSEAEKSTFLAVMSHEIRTPMNAVLASVELLRQAELPPRERELAALANASAVNLLELLDNVLDVSKLNARRLRLEPLATDAAALASGVAAIYRACAEKKGLELQQEMLGLCSRLLVVDPVRLRQILSNLLSNAVKFTRQGKVSLRLELQEIEKERALLCIQVSDTGIGIAPEQQARLFQEYAQADNTQQRYGGTGLGLLICRQLVELMSGRIALDSQPERGTTVTLWLPVRHAPAEAAAEAEPDAVSAPAALKEACDPILVVEDQPANRFIIAQQLLQLGYRAVTADNGAAALALLDQGQRFAMALLDCNLPGISGYQLALRLRRHPALQWQPYLPIIAISATTGIEHQQRCLDSGIDSCLTKPLRLAQLEQIMTLWLDHRPGPAPAAPAPPDGELTQLLSHSCDADAAALRQALQARDWPQAEHYAHRLHGVALSAGLPRLPALAAEMQTALRLPQPDSARLRDLLQALEAALPQAEPSGD